MTLLEKANSFPPFLCRLVARKHNGRKAMSHRDIARKAKMSVSYVSAMSQLEKWDWVCVATMQAFASACGVNHMSLEPHLNYLRRSKMAMMKKLNRQQRELFASLMKKGMQ